MINKILIGSDEGAYTVTNGARTITLTGLSFIPTQEQLAYVYNKTQDKLYYAPAVGLAKCTISGGVITFDSTFPVLVTGDIIHIQMWLPERAYDVNLDSGKVLVQNPEYAHTTSVEALADEANIAGAAATADAGGDTDTIVDADGAFSVANIAVGYTAHQTTDVQTATVNSVASATTIETTTLTGAATWASKAYRLPLVKRYEVNLDTYKALTIQYRLTNDANCITFLKMYATNDASATIDADTNWVDVSSRYLASATGWSAGDLAVRRNANGTVEDIVSIALAAPYLKVMFKLIVECAIATAPTNIYKLFIKKF